MTTITHLLAVITLRDYFVKNRWINLPRIIFMLANLGMLGYTSFVSYSYDIAGLDVSSSLACFFQGERPPLKAAFGGKWAALLIGAIGGHATVIAAMYILPEEKLEDGQWTYKWLGAILRTWLIAPAYTIYGVIIAGQTLTETQALGNSSVNITGSETAWGFGQFLPILLLALPIFAGWETFWEEKDEDRDNRFGKKTLWNHRKSRSDLEGAGKEKRPDLEQRDNSGLEIAIESDGSNLSSDRTLRPALDPHTAPIPSPRLSIPSPAASPPLPSQRRAP